MKKDYLLSDYSIGMLAGYWLTLIITSESFKLRFQNHYWLELLATMLLTLLFSIPANRYLKVREENQLNKEEE